MTELWEDNGGGLHAIVYDENGVPQNIISQLEQSPQLSPSEFVLAALDDFPYADEYDPENYSGMTLPQVVDEFRNGVSAMTGLPFAEPSRLVAVLSRNAGEESHVSLFESQMGINAKIFLGFS